MRSAIPTLLKWYRKNHRSLPWRETRDPFFIWISEIMLQQTQVETVKPYYERFLSAFPNIHALATADEQQVLKLWEGLGYYSRARNLHASAKEIVFNRQGIFPNNFQDLQTLKGLGLYTSAAIASISFLESVPVVDGNVLRVVSRVFELTEDISKEKTKQKVFSLLSEFIPHKNPDEFNQAMMEVGAVICRPSNPKCNECPLVSVCLGFKNKTQLNFPVKKMASPKPHKEIAVGIIYKNGKILIAKRRNDQMLGGMWEFPGGKKEVGENLSETLIREIKEEVNIKVKNINLLCEVDHAFTHFTIRIYAYFCEWASGTAKALSGSDIRWISPDDFDLYPFPKANKIIIKRLMQWLEKSR